MCFNINTSYVYWIWLTKSLFCIGVSDAGEWMQSVSVTGDDKSPQVYWEVCLVLIGV